MSLPKIDRVKMIQESRRMQGILQHDEPNSQQLASNAENELKQRARSRSFGDNRQQPQGGQDRPSRFAYNKIGQSAPVQKENAYGDYKRSGTERAQENKVRFNESFETERRQAPLEVPVLGEAGYVGQRHLPSSISEAHLQEFSRKPAIDDNKAFMHDIDVRFENQDRTINYLLQQINSMEESVMKSQKKAFDLQELDRGNILKVKNDLRFQEDSSVHTITDLQQKLVSIEGQIQREETMRSELREKLRTSEDQSMQMANFIKGLQNQSEAELSQMRNILQSKVSEDHAIQVKAKEKNSILFNELVRIGQESEKQQMALSGLNSQLEERIAYLEQRLGQSEQTNAMVNRKGDAASMFLNEVFEKVEGKLMGLEQNFQLMTMEQSKERDNLGRMEVMSLKHNDEFRGMVGSLQNDFQYKLEVKMTDLVNRLLTEQEERARQMEDMRYQMELKDRMDKEKGKQGMDELRDRYTQMDSNVRQEFQRKDQAIANMQTNLESQIRGINGWIRQEELARAQQEVTIRSEVSKVNDSVRYEIDGFKNQQLQVTDKLSEMIKVEVDQRLNSDKDTKMLVQNLLKNIMNEVGSIKEAQDGTVNKILKEVKESAQDSAERAHFLSRYIDEEILKIGNKTSKQVENLKILCAKLTEQFKKHLINHEAMKKDLYKRFEIIESHLPVYRSELYKLMETTEARTLSKLKELKDALSQTILTNFTALDDRVDQFSELVDNNLETLRRSLQDNREVFVSVVNKTNEEQEAKHNNLVEDLEKVIDEVFKVRVKSEQGEKKIIEDTTKMQKMINDLEAHINTSIITEKSVRKAQDTQLGIEMDKVSQMIKQLQAR